MLRSTFLVAMATLLLGGCAALDMKRPVSADDLATTKRVGVVSTLGTTFHGISIGTTVFNNERFSAEVPQWKVSEFAVAEAVRQLSANSRMQTAAVDRAALSDDQLVQDKGSAMWDAAARQGFDRVVWLRRGVSQNFPFYQPGFGFFERSMLGSGSRCVYAGYIVSVYDVAKRKEIGWEWGGIGPCDSGADNDLRYRASFADYTPEQQQVMKTRLEQRIVKSLGYALQKLELTNGNR